MECCNQMGNLVSTLPPLFYDDDIVPVFQPDISPYSSVRFSEIPHFDGAILRMADGRAAPGQARGAARSGARAWLGRGDLPAC